MMCLLHDARLEGLVKETVPSSNTCRTKKFPRWLNGSCIEAEPQTVPGQDEPVVFSYFTDLSVHPTVTEMAQAVQDAIRGGITSLVKYANRWKKYRLLWKMQRVCMYIYIHVCPNI